MAKQTKKISGKKPEAESESATPSLSGGADADEQKVTQMVRLDPEFQKKLARVAKEAKAKSIGAFIKLHMEAMVEREYKRIVLEEAAKYQN